MGGRGSSSGTRSGGTIGAIIEASRPNNAQRVIQVLDRNKKPVFEGVFSEYQANLRAGKFKDGYTTRIIKK